MKRSPKKLINCAAALAAAFSIIFLPSCEKAQSLTQSESEIAYIGYTVNGNELSEYTVVIPENATDTEKWTAEILADKVYESANIKLPTVTDSEEAAELEILIGNTNRPESRLEIIQRGKYYIFERNSKIVIKGDGFYLGGGAGELITALEKGESHQISVEKEPTPMDIEWQDPRNIILIIGDGMGENHIRLAGEPSPVLKYTSELEKAAREKGYGKFYADSFPYKGEASTLNIFGSTTDSAAAATALATGYKTANYALGMIPFDLDSDGEADEFKSVQNIREAAALKNKSTAVLSTDRYTGATPNGFLVHHTTRFDKDIIISQQKALDSARLDYTYFWSKYDSDELTVKLKKTIDKCNNNSEGFFIMAEEAMIDKFSEKKDYDNAIRAMKRLNDTVGYSAVYAACCPDTVVILTADHETGGLEKSENGIWFWAEDGEHTKRHVPVYALGKGCETFDEKLVENTDIAKFIFSLIEKS